MKQAFGPAFVITSAFIGPGTVVTLSLAGAHYGYHLLWVLVFAVVSTFVLQEMSARIGFVTRMGLPQAFDRAICRPKVRALFSAAVIATIFFSCSAYQVGNISGAATSLSLITPYSLRGTTLIVALISALLLCSGRYHLIQNFLMALVFVMGIVYVITAILVMPDLKKMIRGLLFPSLPPHSLTTALAMIGTTIVPYNLFLHSQVVSKQRHTTLKWVRLDSCIAITIGGVISGAILVTATSFYNHGQTVVQMQEIGQELRPFLGDFGIYLFAVGLFSAGLTSALTAPLAAALVISNVLGKESSLKTTFSRGIILIVMLFGTLCALFEYQPVYVIVLAQAANGLLLPFVALMLLYLANQKDLLAHYVNHRLSNCFGIAALITIVVLCCYQIYNLLA